MKFWLRRRDRAADDDHLSEADQRMVSLEERVEALFRGRFTEDHLARAFKETRRRA